MNNIKKKLFCLAKNVVKRSIRKSTHSKNSSTHCINFTKWALSDTQLYFPYIISYKLFFRGFYMYFKYLQIHISSYNIKKKFQILYDQSLSIRNFRILTNTSFWVTYRETHSRLHLPFRASFWKNKTIFFNADFYESLVPSVWLWDHYSFNNLLL